MGAIAEQVRTWPGAQRSAHPQTSFAGIGPRAADILDQHELDCQLGEKSPLGRLEDAGAWVLLLGVGYDKCTAFHLAEYRLPGRPRRANSCAIATPAGRTWASYTDIALDASDFTQLGEAFERSGAAIRIGRVGCAVARLFSVADAVMFARQWMMINRIGQ